MFPPRMFPIKMFAPRMFPPGGGIPIDEPETTAVEFFIKKGHGKLIKMDRGKSIMVSIEGVIDV